MNAGEVEVIITPSVPEYERLIADLETLREAGATSNTSAIVNAVAEAACLARNGYDHGRMAKAPTAP